MRTPQDGPFLSAAEDLTGPSVSIACPTCRRLVPAGAPCPRCGEAPAPPDVTLVLASPPVDDTAELEPVDQAPEHPADARPEPTPLADQLLALRQAPAGELPAGRYARPPRLRGRLVAAGVAALALAGGAAALGLRSSTHDGDTGRPGSPVAASVTPDAPVAAGDVQASASSTQQPDGGITYAAANTLDGRPETAWNSNGKGAGATLVYTFARPLDLRSITVLDGYQKVRAGSSGRVDLYELNSRVRSFTVVTDTGSTTWNLRDDRSPQTLEHAFGRTRTLRLQVTATYPGRKYPDVAVSEVRFTAAQG